jgi:serine/threonine protein kinase
VFDEQRLLATFCGSPLYASPEIVKGTPYQGPEVDCWSLGVLLYTLVYGAMPFGELITRKLLIEIIAGLQNSSLIEFSPFSFRWCQFQETC